MTTHQAPRISCHLGIHGDKFAGQYYSAGLRVRNVSAFSIQLCWRAAARARGPPLLKKEKTNVRYYFAKFEGEEVRVKKTPVLRPPALPRRVEAP